MESLRKHRHIKLVTTERRRNDLETDFKELKDPVAFLDSTIKH